MKIGSVKVGFVYAWYDFWVGAFWHRSSKSLYILPIPFFGIVIHFKPASPPEGQQ